MKKIITLLFAGFIATSAFSQSMVQDALRLSHSVSSDEGKITLKRSDDSVFSILDKYIQPETSNTKADIKSALSDNPFFEISGGGDDFNWQNPAGGGTSLQGLISGIGNLNVTNLADALAIVVVDRLKAELSQQFFEDFKTQLDSNKELSVLFPTTTMLLNTIDEGIYDYQTYIPALRQAFNTDLKNLYQKIDVFFKTPKLKEFLTNNPEIGTVVSAAIITSTLVAEDKSAADVIAKVANMGGGTNPKMQGLFKTVGLIAKSLQNKDVKTASAWVNIDSVKKLIQDPVAMRLYLGLLYQTAESINLGDGRTLRDELGKFVNDTLQNQIADMLIVVSTAVQDVETIVNNYKTDTTQKQYKKYYDYYESYTDLLKTLAISVDTIFNLNINNRIEQYYAVSQGIGNIYLNVNEANYTGAIINLVATIKVIDTTGKVLNDQFVQKLLRYGTFMAMVVEAKTSEELAGVLNTVILPSGSSSAKSKNAVLLTINSYIGGFYSWKTDKNDTMHQSTGLSLPIGPCLSFGLNEKMRKYIGAISIFTPVFDIGAFGAYRLNDSSTASLPAIKLANIFAPGAMVGFSRVFNTPLTLMGGIQKTPPLQSISTTGAIYTENTWRWQVSLTWDIPLFNLYYKPKK